MYFDVSFRTGLFLSALLVKEAKWTLWGRIFSYSKIKMLGFALLFSGVAAASYGCHHLFGK